MLLAVLFPEHGNILEWRDWEPRVTSLEQALAQLRCRARPALPHRGVRCLERARRAVLALRLRDLRPRLQVERRGRGRRVPGRLHASLHAPGDTSRRLCLSTLDRTTDPASCLDAISGGGREQSLDETAVEEGSDGPGRGRGGVRRSRSRRRPLRCVSGHTRPLLRPGSELSDDLGRARHPCRDDRQPNRPLPRKLRDELEGRNESSEGSRG